VDAEGKLVVGYYDQRTENKIISLKLATEFNK
jgi:hypothetical protein